MSIKPAILRISLTAVLALALNLPQAGWAEAQTARASFDVYLRGFRVGVLAFEALESGNQYSAAGILQSTGWAGKLAKVSYDAKSRGRKSGDKFIPSHYEESADTGSRQSQSQMDYVNGVPQVKKYSPPKPPRPEDVNPATQRGTVDPLTAIYAALRDVGEDEVCDLKLFMFDGRRRSQITLKNPVTSNGSVECSGEYRRLKGFSAEDMAERARFPFTLTYTPNGNGTWQASRIVTTTLYGQAVLKRR